MVRHIALAVALAASTAWAGDTPAPVKIDPTKHYDLEEGLDVLSRAVREKLADKSRVAFSELGSLQQEKTHMGRFVAEELTSRIAELGGVRVVERSQINKIVAEQKLGTTNMLDDDTAARIGKMVGADIIAAGTYTDLGRSVRLSIRLIHSGTAEVVSAKSINLAKTTPVAKLLNQKPEEAVAPPPSVTTTAPKNQGLVDKTADDISKALTF